MKDAKITLRTKAELKENLQILAESEKRSLNEYIEMILEEHTLNEAKRLLNGGRQAMADAKMSVALLTHDIVFDETTNSIAFKYFQSPKVKIFPANYFDKIEEVNPLVICDYLSENGWNIFEQKRQDIKIYQCNKNDTFEQVTIPLDKSLRDYKVAIFTALKTIADVENKSIAQLILIYTDKKLS